MIEFWEDTQPYTARHKVNLELLTGKTCLIICGPRRAGKSFTMYEIRDGLDDKKNSIYVNFEDDRLQGFKNGQFDEILDAYYEIRKEQPVLFLDEVQNVDGFGPYLRRLADRQYKVVATGSNSKLLSREIAQILGGRFVQLTILPLDFNEFLLFKKITLTPETIHSKEKYDVRRAFDEYLNYGGFPEVSQLTEPQNKTKVLQTYFNLVFYQDMVSKEKLQNEEALQFILKKTRENIGNAFTPRSVYAAAKNAGIAIGPNTVEKYLARLEDAYLVQPCLPFAKSATSQLRKKRYFIDNGYIKLFEVKPDEGLMLENLIFTELVKKGHTPRYHQRKKECDFILPDHAIQVTHELNEANTKREVDGLMEAIHAHDLQKGTIITRDQEKTINVEGQRINVIPAWIWCLQNVDAQPGSPGKA